MTIRKSIRVARPPAASFQVFCDEIGRWWPIAEGKSFGGKLATNLTLEGRVGGRFYESRSDGTEYEIGRVTAYQPPDLVAFTWRAPSWDATTQVEVRFISEEGGTRVELEHKGFDQTATTRDARASYDGGWDTMLGHYRAYADTPA